ncbi:hypothetical protein GCM10010420_44550 [Streptomyces glaucosporus]|uniref:RES domain-containing protein n=1 Tax=Streptomyces glaucosporus TaxID=284044 RepID=A0ABN3IQ85_9ACTN
MDEPDPFVRRQVAAPPGRPCPGAPWGMPDPRPDGMALFYSTPAHGLRAIWRTLANPGECPRPLGPASGDGYCQLSRDPGGLT